MQEIKIRTPVPPARIRPQGGRSRRSDIQTLPPTPTAVPCPPLSPGYRSGHGTSERHIPNPSDNVP